MISIDITYQRLLTLGLMPLLMWSAGCALNTPPYPVAPRTSSQPLPTLSSQGSNPQLTRQALPQERSNGQAGDPALSALSPDSANQIKVLLIKGSISRKLLENTKRILAASTPYSQDVDGSEPIPARWIVLLDSKGGDGMAGMAIGKLLRSKNAHVFVTGECSSACVFLLASGVVRGAPSFSVGIHQGRITMSTDAGVIKREVDIKEDPKASALLAQYEREAKIYFNQMGISSAFFQAMQDHSTKGVYRLTAEELSFYGLSGFDESYFEKRERFYAQQKGKWALDKDDLYARTIRVASECAPYEQKQQEFVNCYKKVLISRY
jgi:ATP-dependent protease ClpP protease subunit